MSTARTRPARPAPAARRARAALVLVAFAVANLAGVIHEGLTAHARCAEHGEVIHVARTSAPPSAIATAGVGGLASVHRAPAEAGDGDDHCSIGCALGERATLARAVVGDALPRLVLVVRRSIGAADAAPRLALFRTAPKTSPPA